MNESIYSVISSLSSFAGSMISSLAAAAVYVLTAIAIMTIARRRNIEKPWMAWVPFASSFLMGKVADEYNEKCLNRKTSFAKILLTMQIIGSAVLIAAALVYIIILIVFIARTVGGVFEGEETIWSIIGSVIIPTVVFLILAAICSALMRVPETVAAYQIYRSCNPDKANLFLVFSIIFPVTISIFLFINRNKDLGYRQDGPVIVENQEA